MNKSKLTPAQANDDTTGAVTGIGADVAFSRVPDRDVAPQSRTPRSRDDTWIVMAVLGSFPWTYPWMSAQWASKEREYLGAVQTITYVGSFGVDTQIDTDSQTFLLQGSVFIHRGDKLEWRNRLVDSQACVVGTDAMLPGLRRHLGKAGATTEMKDQKVQGTYVDWSIKTLKTDLSNPKSSKPSFIT